MYILFSCAVFLSFTCELHNKVSCLFCFSLNFHFNKQPSRINLTSGNSAKVYAVFQHVCILMIYL